MARVIASVIAQDYRPALRIAVLMVDVAGSRRRSGSAEESWRMLRDSITRPMFLGSFESLADRIGIDEADVQIRAFAREFIAGFDTELASVVARSIRPIQLNDRDKRRMLDWLAHLEKCERTMDSTLTMSIGPFRKRFFQPAFKL